MTGHVEHLTGAPRVGLWGLSTLFMSVIEALTAVICGSGDRDHILESRSVDISSPFLAPFVEDEGDRRDHGLAHPAIGTEVQISGTDRNETPHSFIIVQNGLGRAIPSMCLTSCHTSSSTFS